jgi:hypothetical protein
MSSPKQNAPLCDKRRASNRITSSKLATHKGKGKSGNSKERFDWRRIKEVLAIESEFARDGHCLIKAGNRLKCVCPFHDERNASCYVDPKRGVFHCFGCGAGGTIIDYHALKRGISVRDAIRELAGRANGGASAVDVVVRRPSFKQPDLRSLDLGWLEKGAEEDLCKLSDLRCISVKALRLAQVAAVLRFGTIRGHRAWIVTDPARAVAQARRLDGKGWFHLKDAKAYTLHGGCGNWPIGVINAPDQQKVVLVEGGPDLLAAYHLLWCQDRRDITPVAMLGAGTSIFPVALPLFAGRRVRIYPHTDESGIRATERWSHTLLRVGCTVDCYDFSDLMRADGKPVRDLNDFLLIGHDEWQESQHEGVLP